jgi:2-keto-3-deoxy-L-rhamnonate aldolase RhmA/mannose/cellobiose epimerase-like protein (N-acyl-D-glucosamine 2-epimerase family)
MSNLLRQSTIVFFLFPTWFCSFGAPGRSKCEALLVTPRSQYHNPVKDALDSKQIVYGGFLMEPNPTSAFQIGSQTHFVWLDAEHGPFTPESALRTIQAFHMATPAVPVIRIPSWDFSNLKPFLETGTLGIVVPEIRNAQEVRDFVLKVKYPPEGNRGFGPGRSTGWLAPDLSRDAIQNANNQMLVIVMIETPEAVENIEEIASVPGIDVLHIGPYDLALKLGRLKMDDPRVLEAIEKVERVARAHDIPLGSPIGSREAAIIKSQKGYLFFTIPSEKEMIASGLNRFKGSANGQDENVIWNNPKLWDNSIAHANDFFIKKGWDYVSGSFHSEIANDGTVASDLRYIIASSRMVYGLAHGSVVDPNYLNYANLEAAFILDKMMSADETGPYFNSVVDRKGASSHEYETKLVVNEQAYGLNGLVALFAKTESPDLLRKIEEIFSSFYTRFHDEEFGGFFDKFDRSANRPVRTKSYNSTVYVATSFLIDLAKLPTLNKAKYIATVKELADIVSQHFVDNTTGWIIENFTPDWRPDWREWQKQTIETSEGFQTFTIGITGHNFQAAWFLMRAAEFSEIPELSRQQYLDGALNILTSMLKSRAIDRESGGVFDAFKREDGQTMWNSNKAWWQQAEALLALTKALSINLFTDPAIALDAQDVRDSILTFYFAHFIDYNGGGEFPVVQKNGTPITTENKGQLGTATYHQVELAKFMKDYAKKMQ